MTIVAIHQPNYAPWLGYFHKLARADVFVFLDDAQFSRGGYTNRVQIAGRNGSRWLTVSVRHAFGAPINEIAPANPNWPREHLDCLLTTYRNAIGFETVWPDVRFFYEGLPTESLAAGNIVLLDRLGNAFGIEQKTVLSSSFDLEGEKGDDRLIAICRKFGKDVVYLSGRGGAKYQDEAKFSAAGVTLQYTHFGQREYPQGSTGFVGGLSALDAVFHLGWERAAALVMP